MSAVRIALASPMLGAMTAVAGVTSEPFVSGEPASVLATPLAADEPASGNATPLGSKPGLISSGFGRSKSLSVLV